LRLSRRDSKVSLGCLDPIFIMEVTKVNDFIDAMMNHFISIYFEGIMIL
jgi:hypothetical protein